MPVIADSSYRSSLLMRSGHLNTLYSALFRKTAKVTYERERLLTLDQDFIDLDWVKNGNRRLIIVTHGLEGSSYSRYLRCFVNNVSQVGWDILAWNLRGCSGVPNLKLRSYHSGSSDDLQMVFSHALFKKQYDQIALVGFSLGGNITLKFLGEQASSVAGLISAAVTVSVPCDLESAANNTNRWQNLIYRRYFLNSLRNKIIAKQAAFPGYLQNVDLFKLKTFYDFDNYYTAPVHGFRTAKEYWRICSSKHYLRTIEVPTLILNAADDPLLTEECFPYDAAKESRFVSLETPNDGGHVAFRLGNHSLAYSELRALEFLDQHLPSSTYGQQVANRAA